MKKQDEKIMGSKMKVAWLCPYQIDLLTPGLKTVRDFKGRSASWIVNLSNELVKQKNIQLHVVTYSAAIPYSQTVMKNNIVFHVIRYSFPFTHKGFPSYFPLHVLTRYKGFISGAAKVLREIDPDVVHAYGTEGAFGLAACRWEYPAIISIQGIIAEIYKTAPSFIYWLQKRIESSVIKKNRYFDCRTRFDTDYVLSLNPGARIFHIPRAIHPVFFRQEWNPPVGNASLLFVGTVIRRKGIEIIMKALPIIKNKFPHIQLKVIGAGKKEYINYLKGLVRELDIETNVVWLGFRPPAEVARELARTTLFVLPTFIDNSPNGLAEAMAVGTPAVAGNVGGVPSMITDGVDGILVKTGSIDDLAGKIIHCLENKELVSQFSTNARQTALKRNLPENVANIVVAAYNTICREEK